MNARTIHNLKAILENANQIIKDKAEKIASGNAAYELGWSSDLFKAAARQRIATDLIHMVENNHLSDEKAIYNYLIKQATNDTHAPASTSAVSNFMDMTLHYETLNIASRYFSRYLD